ncbi:hypothetical protein B4U80_06775 [Leptotrombidium deliense]|uniref:Dedicator of cytokinesis protein 1 n=1 Tax=Leptotrombidium deliense TaxID=299467 RepID=A0A443SV23_9ACAR|nr:hypothetical protein B4U80_06775 [Leptotrombidium deliense]
MVQHWTPVAEKSKYGIVVCNFNQEKVFAHRLQLSVGDTVYIDKECGDWYYGSLNRSRDVFGVFPKNYVVVKDSVIDRTGVREILLPKELPIVQEITTVLREWGGIWKEMYINRNTNFETIREMMQELVELRSQVMSGKLPLDELKEVKRKVTTTIDNGNALLGLDLVVRDEQGNILNPDKTSTIDLFHAHEAATLRINLFVHRRNNMHPLSETMSTKETSSIRHYSYNLYVMVNNFVCRIGEDAQLLMTLYDGKKLKFISENYYIKWGKNGFVYDLDQLNNLKVLFCDLGSEDLLREKVLLVCQVVRIGVMELKEPDQQLKVRSTFHPSKKTFDGIRRPFGVAALEITHLLKADSEADETEIFIPFVQCGEKDTLDSLIKKIISQKSEISEKEHKGQGLFVFAKLLPGDIKYVRDTQSHLVSPLTPLARKMGFPEVILPGDVRNDLYLTLVSAEFVSKSSKANNVEVTVRVCNEKGQTLNEVITFGAGAEFTSEYKSVVYYHDERPKWMETIKISVPVEACDPKCHLKFLFKHRSSNESKDKNEKHFGFSFIKLMNEDGTTLKDQRHDLLLYKIDSRRFDENDPSMNYLSLPSTRNELDYLWKTSNTQISNYKALYSQYNVAGLTLVPKDTFEISTVICSTKLTQNIHLLGLLKWSPSNIPTDEEVKRCLNTLMCVDGEEIVKFLQDILDALFTVLVAKDSEEFNNLLFTALIFIIGLISDRKYEHFRPVLDAYITDNFSSTLAYSKLILVLKQYINGLIDGSIDSSLGARMLDRRSSLQNSTFQDTPLQAMKSLEFLFRFIVKSRSLCAKLNGGGGRQEFEKSLANLLRTLTQLMLPESKATIVVQAACLKYFPSAIPDILTVFDGKDLSEMLTELINSVPLDKLKTQRMACIWDIIHYECLLKDAECRSVLLPVFNDHVAILMKECKELPQCVKVLRAILTLLHGRDPQDIRDDITDLMLSLLPTVIKAVVKMDRGDALIGSLVAIMMGIFRQMTPYHYDTYIEHMYKCGTHADLLDFLMELIIVFKDLVSSSVYPDDWNEMIMLQNSVILNTLKEFSQRMKDRFLKPFEYQLWNNFFHCAIAFLIQKHLQLENFSVNKRSKILSRYKDMRTTTALLIRSVWILLGGNRLKFIPSMIGPFLEMALIPEEDLRDATISIFFDMMQCEFLSPKGASLSCSNLDVSSINAGEYRGHFKECEHEMITQLDKLVEGGKGDEHFKNKFCEIIPSHILNFSEMYDQGMTFVNTVERLMRRLLAYRTVVNEENKENRMICIVNLLEFYQKIGRQEMHIRYLYKLCDLHLECENYTEAAFTLLLHTKLLTWSDEPLSAPLKNDKYPDCETHRELKEKLYKEIIDYFDKGKMWEAGLRVCNELVGQYKNESIDYIELSALLLRMSQFYDNIMKQIRHKPEYFRVSYWGKGFPAFLQNKTFINRGKAYERLPEFSGRLLNQFPNAQLLNSLSFPDKEITESDAEYLQINKVDPIMELSDKFKGKPIHNQILKYYEVNEVKQFCYSRPFRKTPYNQSGRASDNEFANMWIERTTLTTTYALPGIMTWFQTVFSDTKIISPLEAAIETMESTNNEIKNLILQHIYEQNVPLNQLTMRLNGVVDAAVMGGIVNYEKAFFTAEYMSQLTTDAERENVSKLKDLIAAQIPLLEIGIQIHGQRAPLSLKPLHEHMEEAFQKLRHSVESKYGKRHPPKELKDCTIVKIRRTLSKNEGNRKPVSCPAEVKSERDPSKYSSIISMTSAQTLKPIRSMSVWCRPNSSTTTLTTSTLKLKKQRSRENDLNSVNNRKSGHSSHSQWYLNESVTEIEVPNKLDTNRSSSVSNQSSIIELTEQLTPQRPLRQSRPSSGQYLRASTPNRSLSHGTSTSSLSNQITEVDGVEDEPPPPLPVKSGFADYTNFPSVNGNGNRTLTKQNSSNILKVKNKPPPPPPQSSPLFRRHSSTPTTSDSYEDIPPELPKKPSKKIGPIRVECIKTGNETDNIIPSKGTEETCELMDSSL